MGFKTKLLPQAIKIVYPNRCSGKCFCFKIHQNAAGENIKE
jgi:hypothetical protein